jgi:hypothetical protein
MAIAYNGDILVASHDTYVADYSSSGVFQTELGAGVAGLSQVDNVAERGSDLWVLDTDDKVVKLDTSGNYGGVTLETAPSGDFSIPEGIAIDASGCVYISDRGDTLNGYGFRVSKFTSAGVFVASFGMAGSNSTRWLQSASSIAIGPHFEVYVADWLAGKVWRFSPNSARNSYTVAGWWSDGSRFPNPRAVAVDVAGNVFVLDDNTTGQISKLDPSGEVLAHRDNGGEFAYAWSLGVTPGGHVFVDDRDNAIVEELFLANMRPLTSAYANLTVKKGKSVTFKYKAGNEADPRVNVTIKVYKGTKLKSTISCGWVAQGVWNTKKWTCKLAKGTYTWKVYATDVVARTQRSVASKTLKVN